MPKYENLYNKNHIFRMFLLVLGIAGLMLTSLAFYPGFMSPDSLSQLEQTLGLVKITDWHPPTMVIIWKALIALTGTLSSMLLLQQLLYWSSLTALSITIHLRTRNVYLSFMPVLLGFSPMTLLISGVIWKDVLMAQFLMLVSVMLYLGSINKNNKFYIKLTIYLITSILILISGNLRHNAFPAILPLALMASYNFFKNNRLSLIAGLLVMILVPSVGRTGELIFKVGRSNVGAAVMVDDIKSILSYEDIKKLKISELSKDYLLSVKTNCESKGVLSNGLFLCSEITNFRVVSQDDYTAFRKAWIKTIASKPVEYTSFRLGVFLRMLTPAYPYVWHEAKIDNNQIGVYPRGGRATDLLEKYFDFTIRDFGFVYRPYTWLALIIIAYVYHRRKLSRLVNSYSGLAILFSGLIYLFTYLTSAIVYDYRMVYWTVLSVCISLIIFITEHYRNRSQLRSVLTVREGAKFEYTGGGVLENLQAAINYSNSLASIYLNSRKHLNKKNKYTTVDFGSGIGTYAKLIKSKSKDKIYCVELDDNLRALTKKMSFDSYRSIKDIPKPPDIVYSFNVFEHIEDDVSAAKDIFNTMAYGGVFIVFVPAHQALYTSMDYQVEHHRRYSLNEAKRVVSKAGFTIIESYYFDPLGAVGAILYKLNDNGKGQVSEKLIKFFDKYVYKFSLIIQPLTKYLFGKNVVIIAVKK